MQMSTMRIRRFTIVFLCLGLLALTACEDADEPKGDSAEDAAETAIAPEKEDFQRRARVYLDELSEAVDSLEAIEQAPDTLVDALQERAHHLREDLAEVEDMAAVVYRDRHDELQDRLYELEGGVVAARLAAAPNRRVFLQAAGRYMAERERALSAFAAESSPEDRDPQTPHASDLGRLRADWERIVTMLERLEEREVKFSEKIQRDLAEEIGELTVNLRRARDLVQYPEMKD